MAVEQKTVPLTRSQAQEWVVDRGIERLPRKDETLEYIPPGSFNQFYLERHGAAFSLTSHKLAAVGR
jgi:hypothetical protein